MLTLDKSAVVALFTPVYAKANGCPATLGLQGLACSDCLLHHNKLQVRCPCPHKNMRASIASSRAKMPRSSINHLRLTRSRAGGPGGRAARLRVGGHRGGRGGARGAARPRDLGDQGPGRGRAPGGRQLQRVRGPRRRGRRQMPAALQCCIALQRRQPVTRMPGDWLP